MKYSARDDREIRALIKKTPPYESRKTLRSKYDITRFVDKYAGGLGGFSGTDDDMLDKYYIPDHRPDRKAMTQMGGSAKPGTSSLVSFGILLLAIMILLRS